MIFLNTSITEIQHLKELLEDKIRNEYLEQFIQKPRISEEKLRILAFIVNHTTLTPVKKENYIITAMMVQIALDTHELVPVYNHLDETKQEKLSKQLRILAGDYYSSLYYFLLSEIEDFEFIQILATAIKNINESKMKLYYNEVESFEEFIDLTKQIDSMLLLHVANYLHGNSFKQVITDWLFTNKLTQEPNEQHLLIKKWQKINNVSEEKPLEEFFYALIHQNSMHLKKSILNLPEQYTALTNYLLKKLNETQYHYSSKVEEG